MLFGAAMHSMVGKHHGASEALVVATEATKVNRGMMQMKNGVRKLMGDQGRKLRCNLEVAEWPMGKFFEQRVDNYREALPAEETDSDVEVDDADPVEEEQDGGQEDSENDDDQNDVEVDDHDAEDPLPDHRIEVPRTVMRAVGRTSKSQAPVEVATGSSH